MVKKLSQKGCDGNCKAIFPLEQEKYEMAIPCINFL